jgi:hypothetical protein
LEGCSCLHRALAPPSINSRYFSGFERVVTSDHQLRPTTTNITLRSGLIACFFVYSLKQHHPLLLQIHCQLETPVGQSQGRTALLGAVLALHACDNSCLHISCNPPTCLPTPETTQTSAPCLPRQNAFVGSTATSSTTSPRTHFPSLNVTIVNKGKLKVESAPRSNGIQSIRRAQGQTRIWTDTYCYS